MNDEKEKIYVVYKYALDHDGFVQDVTEELVTTDKKEGIEKYLAIANDTSCWSKEKFKYVITELVWFDNEADYVDDNSFEHDPIMFSRVDLWA